MSGAPAQLEETWGELGPAMRALPNDRWRDFVKHYCTDVRQGAGARAVRAAGFADAAHANQANKAYKLLHDERVVAAIAEVSKKIVRTAFPQAAAALQSVIADPTHKDHVKAIGMLLDRCDPVTTRHDMTVTHAILSPDEESLEELRALRQLNVTREKLIEVFGGNYLPRLERLEAAASARRAIEAKTINGTAVEMMDEVDD